jgi:hypothetical protein
MVHTCNPSYSGGRNPLGGSLLLPNLGTKVIEASSQLSSWHSGTLLKSQLLGGTGRRKMVQEKQALPKGKLEQKKARVTIW